MSNQIVKTSKMKKILISALLMLSASTFGYSQTTPSYDGTIDIQIPKLRISVNGGVARNLGKESQESDAFLKQLCRNFKWGYTYGADISYLLSGHTRVGLKYNNMHSYGSEMITIAKDDGTSWSGESENNVNIWYLGPIFGDRANKKNTENLFYYNLGVGYMGIMDEVKQSEPYRVRASAIGTMGELGYDVKLTPVVSIGGRFAAYVGFADRYTRIPASGSPEKNKISVNYANPNFGYIEMSLGLVINLCPAKVTR